MLKKRGIIVINTKNIIISNTKNKIIIYFLIEYTNEMDKQKKTLATINYIRLYKKMLILCELVGINGNKRVFNMRRKYELSCII